jgi:hypothetical protein
VFNNLIGVRNFSVSRIFGKKMYSLYRKRLKFTCHGLNAPNSTLDHEERFGRFNLWVLPKNDCIENPIADS